jgi:hypothetical protein
MVLYSTAKQGNDMDDIIFAITDQINYGLHEVESPDM